uniref:Uncharacterized protein n=1 Tax=Romanomermis culicivorax TaxID=13658 RepID=A0A915JQE8_ROMCU
MMGKMTVDLMLLNPSITFLVLNSHHCTTISLKTVNYCKGHARYGKTHFGAAVLAIASSALEASKSEFSAIGAKQAQEMIETSSV